MKAIKRTWKASLAAGVLAGLLLVAPVWLRSATVAVEDDPLVRMPGTQPADGVTVENPNRCLNCHAGYDQPNEPGFNWMGSMMAQAMRDPVFWACLTVAAQDAMWALGSPNATDLCLRCHSPGGWLAGRSSPTNGSAMTGGDFDGVHCDTCHAMWDPFFDDTFAGNRESNDWIGYWDEAGNLGPGSPSPTLSQLLAEDTYLADALEATVISLFNGNPFFINNRPVHAATYTENGGGQFFVSGTGDKRASFADAQARHRMLYSRYHKSRYFCSTCHDVSNPALANLGLSGLPDLSGGADLISEQYAAHRYFHVERTFSEFKLSAYGRGDGAATNVQFQEQGAPTVTHAASCQDCHLRDVVGRGANKNNVPLRPDQSVEHPRSGLPLHDMTGGNAWVSYILASLDPNGPVYDAYNAQLLLQGPAILTIDFNAGQSPVNHGAALKAGSDRALAQLRFAATIEDLHYDARTGQLHFRILNNTGHKLISGFPEGRRMWANVQLLDAEGQVVFEINPYDAQARTLVGLGVDGSPSPAGGEVYLDELVYQVKPSSTLTGENQTFHFVLADGRYKDNRIPPKGFDIDQAAQRLCEPVWQGNPAPGLYSQEEYAGGYDQVDLVVPAGAAAVRVTLYYQGTSREYIRFLRDEINGSASSLPPEAYVIQSDPFFTQLRAWGDTLWNLWVHNHDRQVPGIYPFAMATAQAQATHGRLPGDFNGDGRVDQLDLNVLLQHWASPTAPPGWVGPFDGLIDQTELNELLLHWGSGT